MDLGNGGAFQFLKQKDMEIPPSSWILVTQPSFTSDYNLAASQKTLGSIMLHPASVSGPQLQSADASTCRSQWQIQSGSAQAPSQRHVGNYQKAVMESASQIWTQHQVSKPEVTASCTPPRIWTPIPLGNNNTRSYSPFGFNHMFGDTQQQAQRPHQLLLNGKVPLHPLNFSGGTSMIPANGGTIRSHLNQNHYFYPLQKTDINQLDPFTPNRGGRMFQVANGQQNIGLENGRCVMGENRCSTMNHTVSKVNEPIQICFNQAPTPPSMLSFGEFSFLLENQNRLAQNSQVIPNHMTVATQNLQAFPNHMTVQDGQSTEAVKLKDNSEPEAYHHQCVNGIYQREREDIQISVNQPRQVDSPSVGFLPQQPENPNQSNRGNVGIDLNNTLHVKQRRRKYTPKVIQEGKPAKKQRKTIPKSAGSAKGENPSGKRKYVRKQKTNDGTPSTEIGKTGDHDSRSPVRESVKRALPFGSELPNIDDGFQYSTMASNCNKEIRVLPASYESKQVGSDLKISINEVTDNRNQPFVTLVPPQFLGKRKYVQKQETNDGTPSTEIGKTGDHDSRSPVKESVKRALHFGSELPNIDDGFQYSTLASNCNKETRVLPASYESKQVGSDLKISINGVTDNHNQPYVTSGQPQFVHSRRKLLQKNIDNLRKGRENLKIGSSTSSELQVVHQSIPGNQLISSFPSHSFLTDNGTGSMSFERSSSHFKPLNPVDVNAEKLKYMMISEDPVENRVGDFQPQNAIVPYGGHGTIIPFQDPVSKKRPPRAKVDLDPETNRVWLLLMGNECNETDEAMNEEKEKWWEEERRVFQGRVDSFISRMHLIQGDRRFSKWKGSVVDSVVGVFLTQNVSDHLSSSAFMILVAKYPPSQSETKSSKPSVANMSIPTEKQGESISEIDDDVKLDNNVLDRHYLKQSSKLSSKTQITCQKEIEEGELAGNVTETSKNSSTMYEFVKNSIDVTDPVSNLSNCRNPFLYDSIVGADSQHPQQQASGGVEFKTQTSNDRPCELLSESTNDGIILESQFPIGSHSSPIVVEEKAKNVAEPKKKIEKEEKNVFDWDSLRKDVYKDGSKKERNTYSMDSIDWEAVRRAPVKEIASAIQARGMNNLLAERIKAFLDRLVQDHGSIDLEWLRDAPPDKAKDYLLSIRGLGLKSVECVRLLTLHHLAFPVDTNVGRICVRLGWVPLRPLPGQLHIHLLEMYPMLETIQRYLWPRLCKLDQRTLYELHYQLITFGKVFCTKTKPNCNACPMRGECKHFASAFASARLALPGPEEKSLVPSKIPIGGGMNHNPASYLKPLPQLEPGLSQTSTTMKSGPIVEFPASPERDCSLESAIEDTFCDGPLEDTIYEASIEDTIYEAPPIEDTIPIITLDIGQFTENVHDYIRKSKMAFKEDNISKALVAVTADAAIPQPKLKNIGRLRTEHLVYELPDSHPLLEGQDECETDDPSPYLLAIWTPGETANSTEQYNISCNSQSTGKLCQRKTCFSCNSIKEEQAQKVRGTLLIPCRTAMRGSFPLNGTYFQVNEVFADHASSLEPIDVPRTWLWNLPRRTVYFGSSVTAIFRGLTTEGVQQCFWRGFICVRGFDQKTRVPRPLITRLHQIASKVVKNKKIPVKEPE